jgi:hypothetical protein
LTVAYCRHPVAKAATGPAPQGAAASTLLYRFLRGVSAQAQTPFALAQERGPTQAEGPASRSPRWSPRQACLTTRRPRQRQDEGLRRVPEGWAPLVDFPRCPRRPGAPPEKGRSSWPNHEDPSPPAVRQRVPAPEPARSRRGCSYLMARGFRAEMVPFGAMHTSPFAEPGTLIPSPVSAVTGAVNLSAIGLLAAFFT